MVNRQSAGLNLCEWLEGLRSTPCGSLAFNQRWVEGCANMWGNLITDLEPYDLLSLTTYRTYF